METGRNFAVASLQPCLTLHSSPTNPSAGWRSDGSASHCQPRLAAGGGVPHPQGKYLSTGPRSEEGYLVPAWVSVQHGHSPPVLGVSAPCLSGCGWGWAGSPLGCPLGGVCGAVEQGENALNPGELEGSQARETARETVHLAWAGVLYLHGGTR